MKLREREYGRSLSDLTNHLGREKQSLLKSSSIYESFLVAAGLFGGPA